MTAHPQVESVFHHLTECTSLSSCFSHVQLLLYQEMRFTYKQSEYEILHVTKYNFLVKQFF